MYSFVICISSLVNYMFLSFAHSLVGFSLCCWVLRVYFIYSRYYLLVEYVKCVYFLPVYSLYFQPYHMFFIEQKLLILMKFNILIFFYGLWFWSCLNSFPCPIVKNCYQSIVSKSFIIFWNLLLCLVRNKDLVLSFYRKPIFLLPVIKHPHFTTD